MLIIRIFRHFNGHNVIFFATTDGGRGVRVCDQERRERKRENVIF